MYNQITSNKRKTVFLMAIFLVIVLALGWIIGEIQGKGYGYGGLIFAAIISLFMTMISYFQGDKVALWTAGAMPASIENNPYVYRMVENLCIAAGLPLPKIYIINDPSINAFATGRDPNHSSIAITTGAIENLENEELEGVIAHELSHIKNFDIRLMMVVIVLVGTISLVADWFMRSQFYGGRGRSSNEDRGANPLAIIGIILIILSPIIAELIKLAVSRKREYLADASGALLTRYPEGLAKALEKIKNQGLTLKRANHATAHLYISNPFSGKKLTNLFSTHPPIEERINILRTMGI